MSLYQPTRLAARLRLKVLIGSMNMSHLYPACWRTGSAFCAMLGMPSRKAAIFALDCSQDIVAMIARLLEFFCVRAVKRTGNYNYARFSALLRCIRGCSPGWLACLRHAGWQYCCRTSGLLRFNGNVLVVPQVRYLALGEFTGIRRCRYVAKMLLHRMRSTIGLVRAVEAYARCGSLRLADFLVVCQWTTFSVPRLRDIRSMESPMCSLAEL